MTRRDWLRFGCLCLALAGSRLRPLAAQERYPERPIKLVVPFAAGGVSDTLGRLWADKVKPQLGSIFIENLSGGGGSIGSAAVARANPDGYTILMRSVGPDLIAGDATSQVSYDPKDLQLISILVFTALTIAVHPSLPVRNLRGLVDYAKAHPGALSYGSAGIGSMPHLAGELFKSLTGATDIVHVPYKGGSQAITDLIRGHIKMIVTSISSQMVDLHRSGKVRILAVTTPARSLLAPDIPTATEAGIPGMIAQNVVMLLAPAGTPNEIVTQIADATHAAMVDKEFRRKILVAGYQPYPDSSPAAARVVVDDEVERWTAVLKTLGLKLD